VPPDELLVVPPVLLDVVPPLLVEPPVDDPLHLPNQHQKVALAGAGAATPIRPAAPTMRRVLLIFIFVTLFRKDHIVLKRPRSILRSLHANFAE
jgi:hypothetical protein